MDIRLDAGRCCIVASQNVSVFLKRSVWIERERAEGRPLRPIRLFRPFRPLLSVLSVSVFLPSVFNAYAICAPGLEALTARELDALDIEPLTVEPGGVTFDATPSQLYAANLQLRTASRVVVRAAQFRARTFQELERHAKRIPWRDFVPDRGLVSFRVTSKKSKLYHQKGIAERLGEAIAGVVPGARAEAPEPGSATPEPDYEESGAQLFVVRTFRDDFTISADSSGQLLHRRGYRLATAKAPLRETLAAAMLLGADWSGTTPLADPFCGSGTIAIEAALLARRIPPGWRRHFAFEQWPGFDAAACRALRSAVESRILARSPVPIMAGDRDGGAIEAARSNAVRAGVLDDIAFQQRALSDFEPGNEPGALLTNPPYGIRIGEAQRLRNLFATLGQLADRQLAGWTVGWLSANPRLDAATELSFNERFRTTNGGIRVRLVVAPGQSQS